MGHYNRIARELAEHPEDYAPVLQIDPNSGEILWEPWIDGFERAMRLRPDAWEEIALSDDDEASASISMIVALNDFYYGRSELTEEAEDELDSMAPGADPGIRAQSERLDQVPAYRNTQKQCCPARCPVRSRGADGFRAQGGPQRALPVRFRPEARALLRRALTGDRQRRDDSIRPAGHRERGQFVSAGYMNRPIRHSGIAGRFRGIREGRK